MGTIHYLQHAVRPKHFEVTAHAADTIKRLKTTTHYGIVVFRKNSQRLSTFAPNFAASQHRLTKNSGKINLRSLSPAMEKSSVQ